MEQSKKYLQKSQELRSAIQKKRALNVTNKKESNINDATIPELIQVECSNCKKDFSHKEIEVHTMACKLDSLKIQKEEKTSQVENLFNEQEEETKNEGKDELENQSLNIDMEQTGMLDWAKKIRHQKSISPTTRKLVYPQSDFELQGCDFCGRKFSTKVIQRHVLFCQKKASKERRQKFDSKMQRFTKEMCQSQKEHEEQNIIVQQEKCDLFNCEHCERKFSKVSIDKHTKICKKVVSKQSRKAFDSRKQRLTREMYKCQQKYEKQNIINKEWDLFSCEHCGRNFSKLSIDKHTKICQKVSKKSRKSFDSKKQRLTEEMYQCQQEHENQDRIQEEKCDLYSCEYCERKFSKFSIDKHTQICQKVFNKSRKAFDSKKQRYTDEMWQAIQGNEKEYKPQEEKQDLFKCEHCERNFSKLSIDKHTNICQKVSKKSRKAFDSKMQRITEEMGQIQIETENQDKKEKTDFYNCEHCERKFSKLSIDKHTNICQKVSKESRKAFDSKQQRLDFLKDEMLLSSIKDEQQEEENSKVFGQLLTKCEQCGRNFNEKAFLKHTRICKNQSEKSPRKKFDSKSQRLEQNISVIQQIEKQKIEEGEEKIQTIYHKTNQKDIPCQIFEQIKSNSVKKYILMQSEIGFDKVGEKLKLTGKSLKFMEEVLIGFKDYSRKLETDYKNENMLWVVDYQTELSKPYLEKLFLEIVDIWVDRYFGVIDTSLLGKQNLIRNIVLQWNFSSDRNPKILDLLWKIYEKCSSCSLEQVSEFQFGLLKRLNKVELKSQKEINLLRFLNQILDKKGFTVFGNRQERLLQVLCNVYSLSHSSQRSVVSQCFEKILKQIGQVLASSIKKMDYSVYKRLQMFEKSNIKQVFKGLEIAEKIQFIYFEESVEEMKEEIGNLFLFENKGQEEVSQLWIEDALSLFIAEDNNELCLKIVKDAKYAQDLSILWKIMYEQLKKFQNHIVVSKVQEILHFILKLVDNKSRNDEHVIRIFHLLLEQFEAYHESNSFISILVLLNEKQFVENELFWLELANLMKRYEQNDSIKRKVCKILERSQMQNLYQNGCKDHLEQKEGLYRLIGDFGANLKIQGCNNKVCSLNLLAVILFQYQEDFEVQEKIRNLVRLKSDQKKLNSNLVKIGLKYASVLKKSGKYQDLYDLYEEKEIWEDNLLQFGVKFKLI